MVYSFSSLFLKGDIRRQHIVCQITHIIENGKGDKLGLMEEDIIMGVHDVHGSHVIKPSVRVLFF